jgi:glycosyltransferase involved in cell wall biosynthesis
MENDELNILQLSAVMKRGGGENHILNLTKALKKREVKNTVYCPSSSDLKKELDNEHLPVEHSRLRIKSDPSFFIKLGAYIKRQKINLVHVHDPVAMFLIILASYFYKLPTVVYSKKTSFPIKNRKKTLYKYNHPLFKRIICVSQEVARVTKLSIADYEKVITIYNGSNLDNLSQLRPAIDLRKELQLNDEVKIILHIANHTKPKDLGTLVECVLLFKDVENVHFVQIGRQMEHSVPILEDIEKMGLNDKITFMGELENASVYLEQADVSLITSKSEGLPQVIYESMYYKKPIVSTKAGGIPEVITNGENGFLADIGDYEQLAKHINHVIENYNTLDTMLDANYDLVHSKYDSKIMADHTLALYKEVLS